MEKLQFRWSSSTEFNKHRAPTTTWWVKPSRVKCQGLMHGDGWGKGDNRTDARSGQKLEIFGRSRPPKRKLPGSHTGSDMAGASRLRSLQATPQCFACIICKSLYLGRWVQLVWFYRWGNWSWEGQREHPKVTQLVSGCLRTPPARF